MNYKPSTNQWNFIKKMWPNIPYDKLKQNAEDLFLLHLSINPGFGHPVKYQPIIDNFVNGKTETLPKEIVEYFQSMEPDLIRKLGFRDGD
jgi:hypothetical protein